MKPINHYASCALVATLLVSCSAETPWGSNSGEGHLRLNVEPLGNVEAAVPAVRAVSTDIVTPPTSDFTVKMVKEGGGYSKSWSSIDEFSKEESFPVGNYTLSVAYGDDKSQGRVLANELGYEHAHYYGESTVAVKEGETTEVHVTATLQNAIVVIEYTESFKKYFSDYSTIVQPSGGEAINLGDNEAMNYVQPGDMNVTISATQPNGKQLTLNPATFTIEPAHMYMMRYNIYNGEIGDAVLSIEFDESLNEEPITVNLSEELDNTRAPQVTTIGFNPDAELASVPGDAYANDAKFSVVADGGISKAVLTIISDDATVKYPFLSENNQIDLCSANAVQQSQLEEYGIKCIGFFGNRDKMGEVDLAGFFDKLSKGKTTFSFQVTDQYTQTNEPVSFSMTAIPVEKSAICEEGYPFAENYVNLTVGYNGPEPTVTGPFSFSILRSNGMPQEVEVASVEACAAPSTRSADYPVHYYKYKLNLPEIDEIRQKDTFNVSVLFNQKDPMEVPVSVIYPAHTMTYDAMATQLRWRVDFPGLAGKENAETLKTAYMNRLRVFVDGTAQTSSYDSNIDAYVINGLTAAKQYNVQTSMQVASTPSEYVTATNVTTETAAGVPNGDFSKTHETINRKLLVGGPWRVTLLSSHSYSCPMIYSEPDDWGSINPKTFYYTNDDNANTWYMVASTFSDDNTVVIRSVGYNHNGKAMDRTGSAAGTTYYNTNSPSDADLLHAAGELFLGSYSYNGSEVANYGYSFTSRPKTFKFLYNYTTVSEAQNENGSVKLDLLTSNGDVIASYTETLSASSSMKEMEFEFPAYPFAKIPSQLRIHFSSSTSDRPGIHIPTGSALNDGHGLNDDDLATNATKALAIGNVLTVSNLRFEY